jgi:crotonobetainyl-CoA:carnitine CoA-transferase CaiB-like acyl-CoA transferase
VVKIENPRDGGDIGRHVGPHFFGPQDSQLFQTLNRNKKSVALDLKHPEGKSAFRALAPQRRRGTRQSARRPAGEARRYLRGAEGR